MALPLYLAMTAAEIRENAHPPPQLAYMACHFSSYGRGLSNFPSRLPPGSILILNDRIPIHGHDPDIICEQFTEAVDALHCAAALLDFQRHECEETAIVAQKLVAALPCPVGVSSQYAEGLSCPVFLPPVPLDVPLKDYLQPFQGREIWLEAALDAVQLTLTSEGCHAVPIPCPALSGPMMDEQLHCHYHIQTGADLAEFTLWRSPEDLDSLLDEAEALGVTAAIGLWQELN